MGEMGKTKEQLTQELAQARKRIAELEAAATASGRMSSLYYGIFENFVEAATDSFSMWDSKLNLVYLNEATLTKYYPPGTKRADIIGKNLTELVPGCAESGRYEKYLNVLNTGVPLYIEEFKPHPKFGDMYLAIRVFKTSNGIGIITIDNTERKRMEQSTQDSQQRLSALIDNAPDIIFSYDINGRFTSGNRRASELLGYANGEMIGKTFAESGMFTEESLATARERLEEHKKGKKTQPIPFELISKDGSHIFVEVRGVPIVQGNTVEVIAIARDITERRKTEDALRQSEEKLTAIFESIGDSITVVDVNGNITDLNDAAAKLFGCKSKEEALGMSGLAFIAEENRPPVIEAIPVRCVQYRFRRMDGSIFWGETSSDVLRDRSGNITGFIGIVRDITERKKTEEALRQSEERLRTYFENAPDAIFVYDFNGIFLDGNRKGEELTGYSKADLIGKNFIESGLFSENYALKAMNAVLKDVKGEAVEPEEYEITKKDGQRRVLEATSFVVKGQWKGEVVGIARDITERKKTEEALRQSEEKLRRIFESIGDAITIVDLNGRIVDVNETALAMSGFSRGEQIGRYGLDLLAERDRARAVKSMTEVFTTGRKDIEEYTVTRKDGTEFPAETKSTILCDTFGKPVGLINILRDITQRKELENKLRQSEEKIRQIFDSVGVGITVTDMEGNVVEINDFGLSLCGCNKEEMTGQNGIRFIAERDRPRIIAEMISAFESGRSGVHEFTALKKDGTEYETETIATVLRDKSGKPTGLITSVTDITERTRIERELKDYKRNLEQMVQQRTKELASAYEELQESEGRLRAFFENVPDILFAHNMEGQFTDINKKALEISGYSRDEIVGRNVLETGFLPADQIEGVVAGIKGIEEGRSGYPYEVQLMKKNGDRITVEAVSFPIKRKGVLEVMGIARDITERKRMENALKNSEEKLRTMFTSMADSVVVTDLEGNFKDANTALLRMFGYSTKEDIRDVNGFDFIAEKDRDLAMNDMAQLFSEGLVTGRSWTFKHSSGSEFQAELSTALLKDAKGNPTDILVVMRDITKRKLIEEALQESEEWHRALVETSGRAGIGIAVMQSREMHKVALVSVNDKTCEISGYSREELLNMSIEDLIPPDAIGQIMLKYRERQQGESVPRSYETIFLRKDKVRIPIIVSVALMQLRGKPATVAFYRDISERKQIEEALRESEQKLRLMFEAIKEGIFVIDLDGRVTEVNRGVEKITGYKREQILGQSGLDYIFPVFKDDAIGMLQKVIARGGTQKEVLVPMKTASGKVIEVEANSSVFRDDSGNPIGLIGVIRDISERKKAEIKLKESKDELRFYLNQITKAQEEERKRIARELHDDTIQELITLSRQIDDLIDKKIKTDEDRRSSRKKIDAAQQKITSILQSVRGFTRDLRPSILDDLGLVPALEWLTSDLSNRFGIPINFSIIGTEQPSTPDAALAMFRIAQESLRNAGQHAKASQIQLNLKFTSKTVALIIIDNGVGFTPPKQTSSLTRLGKLGIAGMYERAQLIGATLSIKSKRNAGTTITLEVPIKHTS